jgi:hypothetical protein
VHCTRIVKIIMTVFVIIFLLGCHSKDFISRGEIEAYPEYPIYMVITVDGEVFEFEPGAVLKDSTIVGTLKDGTFVEISIKQVNMVYAEKFDRSRSGAAFLFGTGTTVLAVTFAVLGIGALVLMIYLIGAAASM